MRVRQAGLGAILAIGTLLSFGVPHAEDAARSREADEKALKAAVERQAALSRRAWQTKNARLVFGDVAETTVVRTPDGRSITRDDMIADLQRRMNLTTRLKTMTVRVDSVGFLGPDTAVVLSTQRFERWMKLPDQPERLRISSVVHLQRFARSAGRWKEAGPLEERSPTARWADEQPVRGR